MLTRTGSDMTVGWCPGADDDEASNGQPGGGDMAMAAAKAWAGWDGLPMDGVYSYPSVADSEAWVYKAHGTGPVSIRAYALPEGFTVDQALESGDCDHLWTKRARFIVDAGLGGKCRYLPGYEGNGSNFSGSAGIVGVEAWGALISRQLDVMRQVDGFDPWVGINYSVHQGRDAGQDPTAAYAAVTAEFHSVDMDWYDTDNFKQQYPITDVEACIGFMLDQYEAQLEMAQRYGLPLGFDEWGAITRSDGHGGGDRVEVIDAALGWIAAHDVAHLDYFNGSNLPGDNCRVANLRGGVYTDAAEYPNVAAWVRSELDPANFIGRDQPPPGPENPDEITARLDDHDLRLSALEAWRADTAAIAEGE